MLSAKDLNDITLAIKQAELQTSGEIRVHIDKEKSIEDTSAVERAIALFSKLQMHETLQRNGVLIYLNLRDKQFAIIGDEGINSKVPQNFWDDIKDLMRFYFKKNDFKTGLVKGIEQIGIRLQSYFPYQKDDVNELPDHVSVE